MENDPLNLYNKKVFSKLFESSSDDSNEKLYKNTLLEFDEENPQKDLDENNPELNIKKFTHNSLLKRVSMEDYILFPTKNDPLIIIEEGNVIEKEEPEKLYEDEVDFLQKINKINYLTFSPLGDSFFLHKYKNENNAKKEESNNSNIHNKINNNKKEEKMLDILDFEYDNYEINNDLLFNISMGYIDIDKLKKENVVNSDHFISKNERKNKEKRRASILNKIKLENLDKNAFKYEVTFKQDLFDSLQRFVFKYKNEEFFNKILIDFNNDMELLKDMEKNSEKNRLLLKWEKEFKNQQIKYNLFKQKKERKERKQIKIQKEMEQKLNNEKIKNDEEQKKFENELNKLRIKCIRKNSIYSQKKVSTRSVDSSSSYTNRHKISSGEKLKKSKRYGTANSGRKKTEYKNDRINWNKQKSNYAFENF
jgi:hypothetical protein